MWTYAGELGNEALIEHVRNLKPEVRQLTIYPTDLCNYRCKMCHVWGESGWAHKEPQRVMDDQLNIESMKRFVEEILAVNKKINVILTGGEPLLYKHFKELLEFLRIKKLPVYLLTNGSIIEDSIPLILDNTIAVNISLDGPEACHDSIRGTNSFKKICDNLEILIREKKKAKKMFPYININMVISRRNYKSIREFVSVLRERLSDANIVLQDSKSPWKKTRDLSISFSMVLFTTKERGMKYEAQMKENFGCDVTGAWKGIMEENFDMDIDFLKNDLEDLYRKEGIDYSNFIDLKDYFYDIDNLFGRTKCLSPWHELSIRRNGDVYPCVDFPDYKIGNINESSFTEIWEGEKAAKFREFIKKENLMICNRCSRLFADKESF